jgi:hypothetical protein
VYPFHNDNN